MTLVLSSANLWSSSSFPLLPVSFNFLFLPSAVWFFFQAVTQSEGSFWAIPEKSRSMCSLALRERNRTLLKHKDQATAMQAYALRRELASSKFILSEVSAFSKTVSWHLSAANKERQGIAAEGILRNQHLRLVERFPTPNCVYLSPLI